MIFRSPFPTLDLPEMPLHDFVLQHAMDYPDKAAIIDGPTGCTLTYADCGWLRASWHQTLSSAAWQKATLLRFTAQISLNTHLHFLVFPWRVASTRQSIHSIPWTNSPNNSRILAHPSSLRYRYFCRMLSKPPNVWA
jgi:hypothetical protein